GGTKSFRRAFENFLPAIVANCARCFHLSAKHANDAKSSLRRVGLPKAAPSRRTPKPRKLSGQKAFVSIRVHSWLTAQHGNQMTQFALDIAGLCHGVSDLLA